MRVTTLSEADARPRRVAVGEFDGVHLGHREGIGGSDTVLTFEPHPLRVVRPEAAPKLLTSFEQNAELIAQLGVEELVVIPFDQRLASQSPREFIDQVLIGTLHAWAAGSVGVRPTFGTGRAVLVEAYLLDRDEDRYGRLLRIDFLGRLRGERRFESADALVEQMHRDVERARELCDQSPSGGLLA